MPNTHMASEVSSVRDMPNAVKSVGQLLNEISKDLKTMDTRTLQILLRSLETGIVLLKGEDLVRRSRELTKTGLRM